MADFLHVVNFHEFLGGYDVFGGLPTMLAWVHAHACIHANFKVVPLTVVILHTQITSTPILVRIRSRVRFSSNMGDSRPTIRALLQATSGRETRLPQMVCGRLKYFTTAALIYTEREDLIGSYLVAAENVATFRCNNSVV